jgi:hypothetical protein
MKASPRKIIDQRNAGLSISLPEPGELLYRRKKWLSYTLVVDEIFVLHPDRRRLMLTGQELGG